MANIFQDKIVKYLTIGLFLAAIGLLVQFLLSKPALLPQTPLSTGQLPQLSDAILSIKNLSNLKVENLKSFTVVETPMRVGRDNPFEPYPLNEEISATTATTTTAASSPSTTATSTNATSTP
ncbi:hypothetical protein COS21_02870 [bacterium (Candidatus Gribaldobacteria) CG02_land_8_20_14_3_00_41_15]|uniref:Uncharacterized protein n=1 Tax=bacterium (Candidatus Gribaldobacteria) CG02_land_8_20_14_3_00_41_15 TaxID=2014270 RepID=A0A2M7DDF6_9BACT|nr:MAG: hypothetical protein COS21_02870 [bacterium (Candidatus Gribaldobacteria) CG02_land_8_20_14_3_00_41_15]